MRVCLQCEALAAAYRVVDEPLPGVVLPELPEEPGVDDVLPPVAPPLEPPLVPPLEPPLVPPLEPPLEPLVPPDEVSDEPDVPEDDEGAAPEGDELDGAELEEPEGELDEEAPPAGGVLDEDDEVPEGEAPELLDDDESVDPLAEGVLEVLGVLGLAVLGVPEVPPEVEPALLLEPPAGLAPLVEPPPESLLQPASSAARMLAATSALDGLENDFIVDSFQDDG
ncbi:MAG: hypothetical protein JWP36_2692 [Paucimonas sp.]|nr:hypothetical protein [Paucimonas sp.]